MDNKEKKLIISFLKELSNNMGNAGCNDWNFPDDWSHEEKLSFVMDYHVFNNFPEDFDKNNLNLPDFCVVDLLAHKLEKEL